MNCYDCASLDHLAQPALGVCHDCGAAVCENHAVARAHHLTRIAAIMREIPVDPPARILRCTTCDAAYAALHGSATSAIARTEVATKVRTS